MVTSKLRTAAAMDATSVADIRVSPDNESVLFVAELHYRRNV
jgi:hypothetical protein